MPTEVPGPGTEPALTGNAQVDAASRPARRSRAKAAAATPAGVSALVDLLGRIAAQAGLASGLAEAEGRPRLDMLDRLYQHITCVLPLLEGLRLGARPQTDQALANPVSIDIGSLARDVARGFEPVAGSRTIRPEVLVESHSEANADRTALEQLLKACIGITLLASHDDARLLLGVSQEAECVEIRVKVTVGDPGRDTEGDGNEPVLDSTLFGRLLDELAPLAEHLHAELAPEPESKDGLAIKIRLEAAAPSSSTRAGKILIVDDDPDGAFLLEQVLAKANFEVEIAHNGLEGLEMARRQDIALVLLDVMLPGIDGYEVCYRLRDDAATARLPIVMISAKAREEDRAMGQKVGANAYMTKPLRLNDVIQTVQSLVTQPEEGTHG